MPSLFTQLAISFAKTFLPTLTGQKRIFPISNFLLTISLRNQRPGIGDEGIPPLQNDPLLQTISSNPFQRKKMRKVNFLSAPQRKIAINKVGIVGLFGRFYRFQRIFLNFFAFFLILCLTPRWND